MPRSHTRSVSVRKVRADDASGGAWLGDPDSGGPGRLAIKRAGRIPLLVWGRLAELSDSLAIQARSIGSLAHILTAGVKGRSRSDRSERSQSDRSEGWGAGRVVVDRITAFPRTPERRLRVSPPIRH